MPWKYVEYEPMAPCVRCDARTLGVALGGRPQHLMTVRDVYILCAECFAAVDDEWYEARDTLLALGS